MRLKRSFIKLLLLSFLIIGLLIPLFCFILTLSPPGSKILGLNTLYWGIFLICQGAGWELAKWLKRRKTHADR